MSDYTEKGYPDYSGYSSYQPAGIPLVSPLTGRIPVGAVQGTAREKAGSTGALNSNSFAYRTVYDLWSPEEIDLYHRMQDKSGALAGQPPPPRHSGDLPPLPMPPGPGGLLPDPKPPGRPSTEGHATGKDDINFNFGANPMGAWGGNFPPHLGQFLGGMPSSPLRPNLPGGGGGGDLISMLMRLLGR